jgi:hypothetical protein
MPHRFKQGRHTDCHPDLRPNGRYVAGLPSPAFLPAFSLSPYLEGREAALSELFLFIAAQYGFLTLPGAVRGMRADQSQDRRALILVDEAQRAGEDVTPEKLAQLRLRLDTKINAFDEKLKAAGH